MATKLNLDKLDLQIIQIMMEDAGISYADLGKQLFVSGGTIHVRIKKLQEIGIVKGTRLNVDLKLLGYDITAFVGIFLEKSSLYDQVAEDLKKIPEIVRLNYTTGNYSMFLEVVAKDITQLRFVLHDQLQKIKGIERTETFISLDESFNRHVPVAGSLPHFPPLPPGFRKQPKGSCHNCIEGMEWLDGNEPGNQC
jgi:Lrp/AsnC family transcriptional regulator for asnA, asnC and gidA